MKKNSEILREKLSSQDLLEHIPDHILGSGKCVILDPDMASGQYIDLWIKDQRSRGFSDENIASRTYGLATDKMAMLIAINKRGLIGNFYPKNILEIGETKSLEFTIIRNNSREIKSMEFPKEFDIVIGNPPYSGGNDKSPVKLWHKFIKKSRTLVKKDGYLSFVVPAFYTPAGQGNKIFREATTEKNLLYYFYSGRAFHSVGIDVCYFVEQNKKYEGSTIFNGEIMDFSNGFVYTGIESTKNSIIKKVIETDHPKLNLRMVKRLKSECNDDGIGIPIYFTGSKLRWIDEAPGFDGNGRGILDTENIKLIFPISSSYHSQFITTDAVCTLNYYCVINSETEGKQIMSYTLSKLFRKIASYYKKTSGFTPLVQHSLIPDLERKMWTDQELYEYFGLTQEEIDFIES